MISTGSSASSPPPTCASRTGRARPSRIARSPSSRQHHEELNAMVARRGSWHRRCALAVADLGRRPHVNGRPSGMTASGTRGRGSYVTEIRDGRVAVDVQVRPDDEEAAFAYAEERVRGDHQSARGQRTGPPRRRSASVQRDACPRSSTARARATRTVRVRRPATAQRRPDRGQCRLRAALARIFEQYSQFEVRTLAVRGERPAARAGAVGRMTPATRRLICTCTRSTTTG